MRRSPLTHTFLLSLIFPSPSSLNWRTSFQEHHQHFPYIHYFHPEFPPYIPFSSTKSFSDASNRTSLILSVSMMAQMVKNLPAVQETQVWFLGWEDPLEKRVATHSSILAWRILWTEEFGGLPSMGSQTVRHDWVTNTFLFPWTLYFIKTDISYYLILWLYIYIYFQILWPT